MSAYPKLRVVGPRDHLPGWAGPDDPPAERGDEDQAFSVLDSLRFQQKRARAWLVEAQAAESRAHDVVVAALAEVERIGDEIARELFP